MPHLIRFRVSNEQQFISPLIDLPTNDTRYNISNLENNTTYYWRVNAFNSIGASAWSDTRSFKTTAATIGHLFVKAKVYLEGPFNSGSMNSYLNDNNCIPLHQPYDLPPWNYTGPESVTSIPSANVVDWVLLELRTSTSSSSIVSQRAAFLKSDGTIVDTNNMNQIAFSGLNFGNYYLVVKHRNHLSIMSNSLISLSDTSSLYDFTNSLSMAYGTYPMADFGGGKFGMFSGDGDANGVVNVLDMGTVGNSIFQNGYIQGDLDMNGIVNLIDYGKANINLLKHSQVP